MRLNDPLVIAVLAGAGVLLLVLILLIMAIACRRAVGPDDRAAGAADGRAGADGCSRSVTGSSSWRAA